MFVALVRNNMFVQGNLAVAAVALAATYYASVHMGAAILAAVAWIVCLDTFRPLFSYAKPSDFPHAKSRAPGEQLPPPYPGMSFSVSRLKHDSD